MSNWRHAYVFRLLRISIYAPMWKAKEIVGSVWTIHSFIKPVNFIVLASAIIVFIQRLRHKWDNNQFYKCYYYNHPRANMNVSTMYIKLYSYLLIQLINIIWSNKPSSLNFNTINYVHTRIYSIQWAVLTSYSLPQLLSTFTSGANLSSAVTALIF